MPWDSPTFCSPSVELSCSWVEAITSQMLTIFIYFVTQPAKLAKLSQEENAEIPL